MPLKDRQHHRTASSSSSDLCSLNLLTELNVVDGVLKRNSWTATEVDVGGVVGQLSNRPRSDLNEFPRTIRMFYMRYSTMISARASAVCEIRRIRSFGARSFCSVNVRSAQKVSHSQLGNFCTTPLLPPGVKLIFRQFQTERSPARTEKALDGKAHSAFRSPSVAATESVRGRRQRLAG